MRNYQTEGIIVKRRNCQEADRIFTIFTKYYGKIRVIGKGVRKITSRKGGSLEIFNYDKFLLAQGKSLDIICEVEIKENFENLGKNLKKIGQTYYLCELIDSLLPEGEKNLEVFIQVLELLRLINTDKDINIQEKINEFEVYLLKQLGYLDKNKNYLNFKSREFIEEILERRMKSNSFLKKI